MGEIASFLSKFGGLTASGVLLLGLWFFVSGKIRPAKHLEEVHNTYAKILEHKDKEIEWWREAYKVEQSTRAKQEEALRDSAEVGRMTLALLQGLHKVREIVDERN
jgi:hypothetical protein